MRQGSRHRTQRKCCLGTLFVALPLGVAGAAGAGQNQGAAAAAAASQLSEAGMAFEAARVLSGARKLAALEEAERAVQAVPQGDLQGDARAAAAFLAGSIRYELGDPLRAEAEYKRAAKGLRDGAFADDAEFARIQALEAAGKDDEAARDWTKWEGRFPNSTLLPDARLAQAWCALRRGKQADAEGLLTKLVAANPWLEKDGRFRLARAASAYVAGRHAEALTWLEGVAADAPVIYLRGLCHAAQGNLLKAAASYQEVAERFASSPLRDAALFAKANAFLTSRAYRSAAEEFERARQKLQDPGLLAEAELRAAASVYLAGAPDSASVLLRGVVERHGGTDVAARAQFLIGEVLRGLEKHEEAIPEFNRVLSSYFQHEVAASAQYRVARCLDALGRRAEATSAYQAVVSGYAPSPEAPAAAYLAGVGLLDLGKPLVAAPYFQLVLDRYASRSDKAGAIVFASASHQELVEAALCLLELSYHRAGNLGQLSGAPHLLLQKMPPSRSMWRAYATLIDSDAAAALGRYPEAQTALEGLTRDFKEHEIGIAANQLLAWTYAQQGRDSLAIATEERMLARYAAHGDGRLASSFLHMAHSRFNQKRYREAAAAYEDFLKRFPASPDRLLALYQAGLCYQRLERAGDAVDRWETIVRDSATAAIAERAWARAGDLYFQAESYADAKRCYTGLLQHFSATRAAGLASLRLAQCEYNAGNDAAALAAYNDLMARFPDTPFAREAERGTEQALYRLGQKPGGHETLAALVEQYPTSSFAADAQFQIARQLYDAKQWGQAAEAFRRVVTQFPASTNADRAQYLLAECHTHAGEAEPARLAYEQFLSYFPASTLRPSVQFQLGMMRFEAKEYMQAAVLFTQLLEDSVTTEVHAAALFNLALCQRSLGSMPEARVTLERYLGEHPRDERTAQIAYQLGDLDETAGDATAALKHYATALAAGPEAALAVELHFRVGRCHETLQDTAAALTAYQAAAKSRDKSDAFRLSALARCASLYELQGEPKRAAAAYRDIARHAQDPELAAAAAGRAKTLEPGSATEDAAPSVPSTPAKKSR